MIKNTTEEKKIFSFDKNFSHNILFSKPDKYKSLEDISNNYEEIISTGSNLSYSPLAINKDGILLELKKFNRILGFNKEEKIITVEAGMTLMEFLNFTLKENLWIPQLPGYPTITIGGAVAANSHGKSCGVHGTIRNSIKSILLFHKINGWINLSENENKEIFDLTIGGLGLTGTIVSVTFNLSKIDNTRFNTTKHKVNSLNECKNFFNEKNSKNSFIYSWHRADDLKNLGKGFVYENVLDMKSVKKFENLSKKTFKFKPFIFPLWNKLSIKFINNFFLIFNNLSKKENNEDFLKVIFPFYGKESYFNFFGKKGFLESQLLIGEQNLDQFIDEFKNLYKTYKPAITLLSLKNMSGEQKYIRFEDNKICFTFDLIKNKSSLLFMNEIDKLCVKYQILPSIIKDSRITKETFYDSYKYASDFKSKLYLFDKKRVYKSEVSKRFEI